MSALIPSQMMRRFLKLVVRLFPGIYWNRYAIQARRIGLKRINLILSFDCDTPEDILAAEKIYHWLYDRGVKSTFAVPGMLLEQGASVYGDLAKRGASFINHGALPHAAWQDGRYWSITFYHELSPDEVIKDIRRGHKIVREITGQTPRGFRAPHFGLYQKTEQLALQYSVLHELHYRFSTSTLPIFAYQRGPLYQTNNLFEIPLMGAYQAPFDLFDSWSFIIDPYSPMITEKYASRFLSTLEHLERKAIPAVLNYYVDPAHVCDAQSFYQALTVYKEHGVSFLTYDELLDQVV